MDSQFCNSSSFQHSTFYLRFFIRFEAIFMILATVLNSVIICAVCFNKRLHTVPNVFIVSLAVSDFIIACVIVVTEVVILDKKTICFVSESFMCTRVFIITFGIMSNNFNHLVISVERWLYIARPFLHQRIVTRRSTACSVVFVWVLSALISINMAFGNCGIFSFQKSVNIGVIRPFLHFILCIIMASVYTHIACLTRRAIRSINKTRPIGVSDEDKNVMAHHLSIRSAWKTSRLLVIVFGGFFLFLTPCVCADVFNYSVIDDLHDTVGGKVVVIVGSLHCCLNFFIYALQDKVFRDVLKKGLDKFRLRVLQLCCRRVHDSPDSNQV